MVIFDDEFCARPKTRVPLAEAIFEVGLNIGSAYTPYDVVAVLIVGDRSTLPDVVVVVPRTVRSALDTVPDGST